MHIRAVLAVIVSKLLIKLLRLFKSGGTTLPGKVANRLYPGILPELSVKFRTIMVTGTNGKTTTSRIIGQILDDNMISHIDNRSGANLFGGIVTTYLEAVTVLGRSLCSAVILEVDEAEFNNLCEQVKPEVVVVTNFFRDQLDRFGELNQTLANVRSGIQKTPATILALNADDSLCSSLGRDISNKIVYFGVSQGAYNNEEPIINQDAVFCRYCKARYEYGYRTYGHLGGFSCPECGYSQPIAEVACDEIFDLTPESSVIKLKIDNKEFEANVNLPGLYNIYNALAAAACGHCLDLPAENTVRALQTFKCGFGRMETVETGGKTIRVILVKNPTGFNQVIDYLSRESNGKNLALLLNDKIADGTDISWIWDVDFEKLKSMEDKIDNIYTGGTRAEELVLRLKYAGIALSKVSLVRDYAELIDRGLADTDQGHSFFILPTYTAMLDVRKVLEEKFSLKQFWK